MDETGIFVKVDFQGPSKFCKGNLAVLNWKKTMLKCTNVTDDVFYYCSYFTSDRLV